MQPLIQTLEERMQLAQDASSLILSIRKKIKYKSAATTQKGIDSGLESGNEDAVEKSGRTDPDQK